MSNAEASDDPLPASEGAARSTMVQGETVSGLEIPGEKSSPIAHRELVEQLNRGYVCPSDAGPAWRAAHEAGVDMALIEDALQMSPGKRLQAHQRALNLVLSLANHSPHDSGS